ncbi:MAG: aminotransferase class IV [Alphaproteobacteria bacterium]|nr:aminotransferase class IV [Alphaproteobacteria bacterium]
MERKKAQEGMIVYLNNVFIKDKAACISPADRGFTLGDGVFDTLLVLDGQLRHAEAHFARLLKHASVLQIKTNETPESLESSALRLLKKNKFVMGRYALRTTITRGAGIRGLLPPDESVPTLLMRVSSAVSPDSLPPVYAVISQTTRRNEFSPLSRIKSLQYGDNLLALLEAKDKDANEALILNTAGHISCSTTGNIFILEKGRLLTPPLSDGALNGITRSIVMQHAAVEERSLTPEHLAEAEGIYLTNSLSGIRAVEKLKEKTIDSKNAFYNALTGLEVI